MRCGTITNVSGVDLLVYGPDLTSCAGGQFVALSQAEYLASVQSPFVMSVEDGGLLSVAIVATWAIGWAFRMLIRTLRVDEYPIGD